MFFSEIKELFSEIKNLYFPKTFIFERFEIKKRLFFISKYFQKYFQNIFQKYISKIFSKYFQKIF